MKYHDLPDCRYSRTRDCYLSKSTPPSILTNFFVQLKRKSGQSHANWRVEAYVFLYTQQWCSVKYKTRLSKHLPKKLLGVHSFLVIPCQFRHVFPWMRFEQEHFRTFTWTPPITACSAADWKAGSCFLRRQSLEG